LIRIEEIVLKDFKSFSGRVRIPLSERFTAIVGPNGSGKSNVVDAICFVLGMNRAKLLRAGRLSDLIFFDGKRVKDKSEVSLIVRNGAEKTKVSRVISKKGESKYYLNGRRVKREELLDFLSSLGIKPDGYNFVLQGDISKVIQMNKIERRELIEEIAGISEYEKRKERSLNELRRVEENLGTLNALVNEVWRNVSRLSEERERAIRYKTISDEISRKEIEFKACKYMELSLRIEELHRKVDAINEKLKVLESDRNRIMNEYSRINEEIKQIRMELSEIEAKKKINFSSVLENIRKTKSDLETRIRDIKDRISSLSDEIDEKTKEKDGILREIQEYSRELRNLGEKLDEISVELRETKERRVKIKRRFSELDRERVESLRKIEEIEKNIREIQEKLEKNQEKESGLSSEMKKVELEVNLLAKSLEEHKFKLLSVEERISNLSETISKNQMMIGLLKRKVSENMREMTAIGSELEEVSSRQKSLEIELIDLERRVPSKEKIDAEGVHGRVFELIRPKSKDFIDAIEACAGRRLENIVVQDWETAKRCAEMMKKMKLRRKETLLPIKELKPRVIDAPESVIGRVIDLIDFDEQYRKVMEHIFGGTIVVRDLNEAKKFLGKYRMVTLDGDLIERSASLTVGGGKIKKLMSQAKLEKIRIELEEVRSKRESLSSEYEKLRKEKDEMMMEISALERENKRLSEILEEIKSSRDELSSKIDSISNALNEKRRELSEVTRSLEEVRAEISSLRTKLEELENIKQEIMSKNFDEIQSISNELETIDSKISYLISEKERIEKKASEIENRKKGLDYLRQVILKDVERLQGEKEMLEKELDKLKVELSLTADKERDLISEIERASKEILERQKIVAKKERHLKEISREIEQIEKEIKELVERKGYLMGEISRLEEERSNFEISLPREIEFRDPNEILDEIEELKRELDEIGEVNMRAIEEYDAEKSRYDELKEKRDKLLEERESILKLIREIDSKKKEAFLRTFEEINRRFGNIFSELSPGGTAELTLDDRNDPFRGGVGIMAKPRGKELKRLEAMSGGEQALTAIALIFAIQSFKPAPFYVFDEIDANLDPENVERVAEMIKRASSDSQFLVVSLREEMVSRADVIIGIKNEGGRSKAIGLSFSDLSSPS